MAIALEIPQNSQREKLLYLSFKSEPDKFEKINVTMVHTRGKKTSEYTFEELCSLWPENVVECRGNLPPWGSAWYTAESWPFYAAENWDSSD